jgi:hypothetical protein
VVWENADHCRSSPSLPEEQKKMPLKWESKMLFDIDVFLLGVEKSKFANERLWLISDKISKSSD